jgi:hypothetical protein
MIVFDEDQFGILRNISLGKKENNIMRAKQPKYDKTNENTAEVNERLKEIIYDRCIRRRNWISVGKIVKELSQELDCDPDVVVQVLVSLIKERKIVITEYNGCSSFLRYARSPYSDWFWWTIFLTLLSLLFAFVDGGFGIYLRYFLSGLLIVFLPGFSIAELLYSSDTEIPILRSTEGSQIQKVAISVGLSLVLTPSIALILNNSLLKITMISLIVPLVVITLLCAIFALLRQYGKYKLKIQLLANQSKLREKS